MDKHTLRDVIESLRPEDIIQLRLRTMAAPATFKVIEKYTGKGKGGSRFAVLEGEDGTHISIGTPNNTEVLSVATDGLFLGVSDERFDLPPSTPKLELAAEIKAKMRSVVGDIGNGRKVRLSSSFSGLNGTFTICSSKTENGKFGQIHFWLLSDEDPSSVPLELWSYRHSGLLDSFEVLPETDSVPSTINGTGE